MKYHYTDNQIIDSADKVTVGVVGAGGTGSQVITGLARLDYALRSLGHMGLEVTLFDGDTVSESNIGRQLFSRSEIGMLKSEVLVQRINRFFGVRWQASGLYEQEVNSNILITCVDNVKTRKEITPKKQDKYSDKRCKPLYWLDYGNSKTTGQVILGTFGVINQPKSKFKTVGELPTVIEMYPELEKQEMEDDTPSCSLAEALGKQDLFINSTLAQFGLTLLWKMFREYRINTRGCFINLDTMKVNPIKII